MNSFCFTSRLLHFKKRWMQQKPNKDETQAVMTLLIGLWNNVDFTHVASGFHREKAAFMEVTNSLDDLIIFSASWEEHLTNLRAVLSRLQELGLSTKPSKYQFAMTECTYLGREWSGQTTRR